MNKWIIVAAVIFIASAAVFLKFRKRSELASGSSAVEVLPVKRTELASGPSSDLTIDFFPVKSPHPDVIPQRNLGETLKFNTALAAANIEGALEGHKMSWSSLDGWPLYLNLGVYQILAGQPVFIGSNIRKTRVRGFNFATLTKNGLLRDFEEAMNTQGIVFVRDRTNAVWVMDATNELAFRRKFGLTR